MAKISARGATKLAEASIDMPFDQSVGGVARLFYVLRSDGAILKATSFPNHPRGAYDRKRTGYTIIAKIKPGNDIHEVFNKYVARNRTAVEGK
jgi:hypothetical protein